ncbi:MAG: tetratricopeptide repeat protein [Gallionella sp.]|nr:tetratricopeptide repeat protein [Gallionella sp.]
MKPERNAPCPCGSGKKFKHCCERKVVTSPTPTADVINQHIALYSAGRYAELESRAHTLVEQYPDFGFGWQLLGGALQMQNKDALPAFQKMAELMPNEADAHYNLGVALKSAGRYEDAVISYRRALQINPNYAEAHYNLGNSLKQLGQLSEAEDSFRHAMKLKPDFIDAQGNLIFCLNFSTQCTPEDYLDEALRFGKIATQKVTSRYTAWLCNPHPQRLKVGIVSGDLCHHPVGYFTESLLALLDPTRIELIAYPTQPKKDDLTVRIKPRFSQWHSLVGLNDQAAAQLIHADRVNVLLDLSGHTAHSRLPIFAWKPAPVQCTWLGLPTTTGMTEMDYVLGDPIATPPEDAGHFSEKIWRLPETYICLSAPDASLNVSALPALANGFITFASFNNLAKMNDATVALWARILTTLPTSRLLLKAHQLKDTSVVSRTMQRFSAHGIAAERLILEGPTAQRGDHLSAYHRADIALDPFPYPGVTTSAEALWMGVPVLSMQGDRFMSRTATSIAHNAGLPDWIATNEDDYVTKAVQFSSDLPKLADLREGLREQVRSAPLFDASRFAKHFEQALWGMWQARKNQHDFQRPST